MSPNNTDPLAVAHRLVAMGAPVLVCKPTNSPTGFALPPDWQNATAADSNLDAYRPGDALILVTGHGVDALDVDPRNGGEAAWLEMRGRKLVPRVYAEAATPSGGRHYLVASLDIPKMTSDRLVRMPGVDILAGDPDGRGRSPLFLAPTERVSKVTGKRAPYRWLDVSGLDDLARDMVVGSDDANATRLRTAAQAILSVRTVAPPYEGPTYDELSADRMATADSQRDAFLAHRADMLEEASHLDLEETDSEGRRWDDRCATTVLDLARLCAADFINFTEDDATDWWRDNLPPEIAAVPSCASKINDLAGKYDKIENHLVPVWEVRPAPTDEFDAVPTLTTDVVEMPVVSWKDEQDAYHIILKMLEEGRFPSMFAYADTLMVLKPGAPAEKVTGTMLRAQAQREYIWLQDTAKGPQRRLPPLQTFAEAATGKDVARVVKRILRHPVLLSDGTVAKDSGYYPSDEVFLSLESNAPVATVPETPTPDDLATARATLERVLEPFAFSGDVHRSNACGALFGPALSLLAPSARKAIIVKASQPGSGKTLYSRLLQWTYAGTESMSVPRGEEWHKLIISILMTQPAVHAFDNYTGVLSGPELEATLTSRHVSDRLLGGNKMVKLENTTQWVFTGNGATVGGDMGRRILPVAMRKPLDGRLQQELGSWAEANAHEILWAVLTLARHWVVAGMPCAPVEDGNFTLWTQATRGVMEAAGLPHAHLFGDESASTEIQNVDADDFSGAVSFLLRAFPEPGRTWTVRDAMDASLTSVTTGAAGAQFQPDHTLTEYLPDAVLVGPPTGLTRRVGHWFKRVTGVPAAGHRIEPTGKLRDNAVLYTLTPVAPDDARSLLS